MADLFTLLARRTLEPAPRLAVRLPSRFEARREAAIETEAGPPAPSASSPGPPAPSRTTRMASEPGATETSLPESLFAAASGDTTSRPAAGTATPPASAAPGGRDAGSGESPRPLEESILGDGRSGRPPRDSRAGDQPERGERGRPPASDRQQPEVPRAAPEERRRGREARSAAPPVEAASERGQPALRQDEAAELVERLRPLLPRQPVAPSAAHSTSDVGAGDRGDAQGSSSPPPAVEITIGSIEVRAVAPSAPQAPSRPGPTLTLDAYLKRRDQGGP